MKDDHSRRENLGTQALPAFRAFNRADVLTEGWYPALPVSALPGDGPRSVVIGAQRVVVWRGADGHLACLDAFCPHMGADLGNGRVRDGALECYFHQWRWGTDGALRGTREGSCPAVRTRAWPVAERYGWIWVYAGDTPSHPVPVPPGAEGPLVAWHLGSPELFAHHHVMMVGGIDLQHFGSVHGLDVRFETDVSEDGAVADWRLHGEIPPGGWRARLGRWLLGGRLAYHARFAGGSVVTLAYGPGLRWWGTGGEVPPLYILWGCVPLASGVSRVEIFLLAPRGEGPGGWLRAWARLLVTAALLGVLRDDDVKAFPNMRFQLGRLLGADTAVARLARFLDGLPISPWTPG